MKEYTTKEIRNVVLLGATKSGKTTLAEAMLYEGKVIDRRGSVEDKNTLSDYNELEKINQRSIYASPLYAEFLGAKVNIIDAPGADDFIGGAYSAFRVCERKKVHLLMAFLMGVRERRARHQRPAGSRGGHRELHPPRFRQETSSRGGRQPARR